MPSTYLLRILRGHPGAQYWEEFELPLRPSENIISALMAIQRHPINRAGERVAPVVWESGCLEEVCGACSMLINGTPRQACTCLIEQLPPGVVTVAPLSKFPLVRDLVVDRSRMFENLKKVQAWVEVDDSRDIGFGPRIAPERQELMYELSTCFSCGCCLEACPQINARSSFIGPAAISQARLFGLHPVASMQQPERLRTLMGEGGVGDCGNAHNCTRVCPKKIPLSDSIAAIGREVTVQALRDLFGTTD